MGALPEHSRPPRLLYRTRNVAELLLQHLNACSLVGVSDLSVS